MIKLLIVISLAVTLTACLNNVRTQRDYLHVKSQPAGATIYEVGSGQVLGVTPVWLNYGPADKDEQGCYPIRGLRARWQSGAEAYSNNPMTLCYRSSTINLNRPEHPGLSADVEYGIHVETLRYQKERDEAEARERARESNKWVTCTTTETVMGTTTTTCYEY